MCKHPAFRDIVCSFSEASDVLREQLAFDEGRNFFHREIPDFEEAFARRRLVVLNDLLNKAYWMYICDLFTSGTYHRNVIVILITQNLLQKWASTGTSLNNKYLVLFKKVRDMNQFAYLEAQLLPKVRNKLYESYFKATLRPRRYKHLNLAQNNSESTYSLRKSPWCPLL